jgi:hypothetical protein
MLRTGCAWAAWVTIHAPLPCRRALAGLSKKSCLPFPGVRKSTLGAFEIKDENARLARANNRSLVDAF